MTTRKRLSRVATIPAMLTRRLRDSGRGVCRLLLRCASNWALAPRVQPFDSGVILVRNSHPIAITAQLLLQCCHLNEQPNEEETIPTGKPGRSARTRMHIRDWQICKIHTITALTDSVETLGTAQFSSDAHTIDVCLNVGHPGISAAAISLDQQTLNYYISEMCQMGANQICCESGAWPWPHEDWHEFVAACDSLGRNIRDFAARSQSQLSNRHQPTS
jgi:hypothetical protein